MTVVHARPEQEPQLIDVLVESFAADPICNWMVRSDARRGQAFRTFFQMWLRMRSFADGEVLTTEEGRSAFIWLPSSKLHATFIQQLRSASSVVSFTGWRQVRRLLGFFDQAAKQHPKEPHLYLQFLGVHQEDRRKRVAAALMNHVLSRADREGLPCYAETSEPRNLDIWRRFGLLQTGEILVDGAPPVWTMLRKPGASKTS
ncbi:MAG: GNAT family N-acetyltransferase [Myxococcales bacterium]|nr:GNAT family N-acetyltransferase [Myxococcales bacterium]HRC54710.1 GNAT family N-acetyltransferase [Kofleriaceae bacterium]